MDNFLVGFFCGGSVVAIIALIVGLWFVFKLNPFR